MSCLVRVKQSKCQLIKKKTKGTQVYLFYLSHRMVSNSLILLDYNAVMHLCRTCEILFSEHLKSPWAKLLRLERSRNKPGTRSHGVLSHFCCSVRSESSKKARSKGERREPPLSNLLILAFLALSLCVCLFLLSES